MSQIKSIKAREILDSRGKPTLEVELFTDSGSFIASVPSGTSKGEYEAVEIRDGGDRYLGEGVLEAVKNINGVICPELTGKEVENQKEIDELMIKLDGTENKSSLGANAILPVSLACLRAGAASQNLPLWQWISKIAGTEPSLPSPCILYMEGGLHGKGNLETQEIMVVLEGESFKERLRTSTEIFHNLGEFLARRYGKISANIGLEGAYSPLIDDIEEALEGLMKVIKKSNYKGRVDILLDMAANCLFQEGSYFLEGELMTKEQLQDFYLKLCQKYPIQAIEDPFAEEDWSAWRDLNSKLKSQNSEVQLLGDDLTVTNIERIKKAVREDCIGGVIVKPNQIGTVTEAITAAKYALSSNLKVFIKHRSGETKDSFIADLAVGLGSGFIMAGAPTRGERVAKYNRLLKIEEEIKHG